MDGNGGDYLIVPAGGSRIPASIDSVKNRSHFIKQDGKTVFKYAVKGMAEVSKRILIKNKLSGSDISLFIPHQANKRIIDAAARKCGIEEHKVLINIEKYAIIYKNSTIYSQPIAKLEIGRLLMIKKCKPKWCEIKTGNYEGWVLKKYLWGKIY